MMMLAASFLEKHALGKGRLRTRMHETKFNQINEIAGLRR